MPDLENMVRRRLAHFVMGQASLRTFNRWFIPSTWDVEGPRPLLELINNVKEQLDEYDNRHLTQDQLREKLSFVMGSFVVGKSNSGTSSKNITLGAVRLAVTSSPRAPRLRQDAQYLPVPQKQLSGVFV